MPETPLEKTYEAALYEDAIYQRWETSDAFIAKIDPQKKPFVISMPPPNATGTLHLGHATMLAIEDIMTRYKRMQGFSALWLPGTDHAAIATQNKVEKIIAGEGLTRKQLGREAFLQRVREYVAESQNIIRNQIRKMGSSCDWTREKYTLDDDLSKAVNEVFVRMYQDGLIYRGYRIVNWCPRCQSTLADDEVIHEERTEKLYWLKYGPFILATARPETKLGDTAVAVHPKDKRYKKHIGKKYMIPGVLGEFEVIVVADTAVLMDFGTGIIKVTPAHDFTDFEIGQRHALPLKKIINEEGRMMENCGKYAGLTTRECRDVIVKDMEKMGIMEKIEDYTHSVGICYRCSHVIEPLPSEQWFVDVNKPFAVHSKRSSRNKIASSLPQSLEATGVAPRNDTASLKELALRAVKNRHIHIIPDQFRKTYFHWMENLRDWCISRQIWWGHRIPVWYCASPSKNNCKKPIVSRETPKKCPSCNSENLKQDPDTLDTWFSSALWTFSTLGWPKETADFKYFHPTSVMETGHDILFFWVARMILMTTYAIGDIPFKTVYLHGLVRDKEGRKMSKSLGNGIDPLDMIAKYGADAVRLSMIAGSTPGNDIRLYEEKIAGYRNFMNKIWNAGRFTLTTISTQPIEDINIKKLSLADKWILSRTNTLIRETTKDLEKYRFSDASTKIYDFTWNEFCDWYLECCKVLPSPAVLKYVFETILKLLHPFMPFVTEALWEKFQGEGSPEKLLMVQSWPRTMKKYDFKDEEKQMNMVFEVIRSLRAMKLSAKVDPAKKIPAVLYGQSHTEILREKRDIICRLAGLSELTIEKNGKKVQESLSKFIETVEIYVPLAGLVDKEREISRLAQEAQSLKNFITSLENRLLNKNFTQKAPIEVVEKEKAKLSSEKERLAKLEEHITSLRGN
ncbi:valine--tRNA ligase [Candidatus Peregrinibacteria bacterium]|nr:valine--tRNA ligase [Candidatus Peregrinibacteria bacterium]